MTETTEMAKYFAELDAEERDLKSRLKEVKDKKEALEENLLEKMAEDGVPRMAININYDGKEQTRTLYTHKQLWAGYNDDKQALIDALKQASLDDMVSEGYNTQTLSAYVRQFDPDGTMDTEELRKQLPTQLQSVIKLSEKFSLRTRKA